MKIRHLILVTVTVVAATCGTVAAYAEAHTPIPGGRYVVQIDGTVKGGFTKTYNTGETVSYKPLGQAQQDCVNGPESEFDRCMGRIDGAYPLLTEWKRSLEKAH